MTEIALNPAANAALAPQTAFTVDLQMWAAELSAAHSIGRALASTDFVPASLKTQSGGRPKEADQVAENVAACILAGKALGLDPMNSIQNIFVVHGRPAMYARTMAALVLAAGHELERVAATETRVVYRGRRAGKTEWQEFEWTIQRAQKAGYTTNKKYQTDPIAMLTAKCQSEACRVIAPDVLTGVAAVSVEEVELEDLGEAPGQQAAAPAAAAAPKPLQRARRQPPAPVAPVAPAGPPADLDPVDDEADALAEAVDKGTGELAPEQPAEQAPAPEQAEQVALCTEDQQDALNKALKAAGYTNRGAVMKRAGEFAGRAIASSKQLTETEAIDLTAQLWEEVDANATAQLQPLADLA
jgi:hypothetical protein